MFENGWYCACGAFHPKEEDTVYCTECRCDRILLQNALNLSLIHIYLLLENAEQRIYEIRSGRDSSALTPLSSSMVETLTNLQTVSYTHLS